MNAIDGLEVLLVAVATLFVATGIAASALNVLFACLLGRERQTFAK
jgi:hypothetical protein